MVLHEHRTHSYDASTLLDEANYKQTPIFSASLIKSDDLAVRMARILKEMGVRPDLPDGLN